MVRKTTPMSDDDARSHILQYLYERHCNATSARGKRGAAVKIMVLRGEMKVRHGVLLLLELE